MARRRGEGHSCITAVQQRGWHWLPNSMDTGFGLTVLAQHVHTSNSSQRIHCLSVENYILKNNHSITDLSLVRVIQNPWGGEPQNANASLPWMPNHELKAIVS